MNEQTAECWAFARTNLHLSDEEFWTMTAREFRLLADQWDKNVDAENRRTATVCATIANSVQNERNYTADDFISNPRRREPDLDAAFAILEQLKQ